MSQIDQNRGKTIEKMKADSKRIQDAGSDRLLADVLPKVTLDTFKTLKRVHMGYKESARFLHDAMCKGKGNWRDCPAEWCKLNAILIGEAETMLFGEVQND